MNIGQPVSKVMGRIRIAALLALTLLSFSTISAPQAASTNSQTSDETVQDVVARQLSAFRTRNAPEAYAVTSSSVREKYKSPLSFTTMMRVNFWDLYNHASYRFLGRNQLGDAEIQKVEVTGENKVPNIYLFRLTRAESGEWLIDNVIMLDPEAQPI